MSDVTTIDGLTKRQAADLVGVSRALLRRYTEISQGDLNNLIHRKPAAEGGKFRALAHGVIGKQAIEAAAGRLGAEVN